MKTKDIRDQSNEQLGKTERELEDQLFKLRFQMATNQNENPGRIRLAKKDLARVKTLLSERRIAAEAKGRSVKVAAAPGKARGAAAPGKARGAAAPGKE